MAMMMMNYIMIKCSGSSDVTSVWLVLWQLCECVVQEYSVYYCRSFALRDVHYTGDNVHPFHVRPLQINVFIS